MTAVLALTLAELGEKAIAAFLVVVGLVLVLGAGAQWDARRRGTAAADFLVAAALVAAGLFLAALS